MNSRPTMQSVILALQDFWAERGCLIWQPYYTQVGAGTMNPATFLRALGPEPWRVAYVEPSIRPDDARYGENPNRLQQHYQFQVILKPDPGNPQEVYLESLLALGIDPAKHDLRFVEDRWEAPGLGAWGLGWEVWLDGQEITQFTYFQQAGGMTLDPVSVEITYGLERILIGLLMLSHFKEIPWNETLTYGDVQLQAEREHGAYYLEHADVDRLRSLYELSEAEARQALEKGLVLPAYDNLLRCSHTFNVLDSRGAVGVTERAALFGRMRELSRAVAERYLAQREELGFPWMDRFPPPPPPALAAGEEPSPPSRPETFVLEIGTEELPTGDVTTAIAILKENLPLLLDEVHLDHGAVEVLGTPRRLVVTVADLAPGAKDSLVEVKGPPESQAFDASGSPTKAALGWARKYGIDGNPETLRSLIKPIGDGRYLAYSASVKGASAAELLSKQVLGETLRRLHFDQSMRWIGTPGDSEALQALRRTEFARPIRWMLALHGESVVPFTYAGLSTGRTTRSLRFHEPKTISVRRASELGDRLAHQGILLDPEARQRVILDQAHAAASAAGGRVEEDPALLAEVANLVEAPQAFLGSFDPSHLSLPSEVLVAVMKKHQRYFPVRGEGGRLQPNFVAVRNGDARGLDSIRAGNEHVLGARFADAAFFLRKDRELPLEAHRPQLGKLVFHVDLGSMLDKADRIEALAPEVARWIGASEAETATVRRAAHLCKADLATAMVAEMTSLQGTMGAILAEESGEAPDVAAAIREHYQPRFAGDALPGSLAGAVVGVADRLDTLTGLFAAGAQPTGARDPFGLRRTAVGLIQILVSRAARADLAAWFAAASRSLPIPAAPEALAACLAFVTARQEALLLAEGHRYDAVAAVLAEQGSDPAGAAAAVSQLEALTLQPDWPTVFQAYARCVRILRSAGLEDTGEVDPGRLQMEAERNLNRAVDALDRPVRSVPALDSALRRLVEPITAFFDDVLVMDEDPGLRENRLALVGRIAGLARGIADLSKLEGF